MFNRIKFRLDHQRDLFVASCAKLLKPKSTILDVGAGSTKYRSLFSHCQYAAQDFCQHSGSAEGPMAEGNTWQYGLIDYVCDATSIPVESASFDAVLCTEVLEHVPDPDLVLKEIGRILKPGGHLFLTAPLTSGLHQEPHHFFGGYTPYYYKLKLGELGFKKIEVIPNGGFYSFHSQETQRFSAWIAPWRQPFLNAVLLFPIWLLGLPWCRVIYPLIAPHLDKSDKHKPFTVGYHVIASK